VCNIKNLSDVETTVSVYGKDQVVKANDELLVKYEMADQWKLISYLFFINGWLLFADKPARDPRLLIVRLQLLSVCQRSEADYW
jgi:hypothetical protein